MKAAIFPQMQQTTKRPHTSSDESRGSLTDPPGYIKPSLQDLLLTDTELREIARTMEVEYLGHASFWVVSSRG